MPHANSATPMAARITLCTASPLPRNASAITNTAITPTPVSRVRHPPGTLALLVAADASQ